MPEFLSCKSGPNVIEVPSMWLLATCQHEREVICDQRTQHAMGGQAEGTCYGHFC